MKPIANRAEGMPVSVPKLVPEIRHRKVTNVYMAVVDLGGDDEIVHTLATRRRGKRLPLVAIDEQALAVLKRYCQQVATESGETVSIICFTDRKLYASYSPVTTGN
jgi:hypothetical protein